MRVATESHTRNLEFMVVLTLNMSSAPAGDELPSAEAALTRLLVLLPRLSQRERQRLYEELHARYDCRIYR